MEHSLYSRVGKRGLDLVLAIPALIVAAPLIVLLGALVRFHLGRPVFFRQLRPGLGGVPFLILKLRTMREAGSLTSEESRLTDFGRFLRRWSLDELPELWNIVRGEMSLVGPRPLLMEYLPRYDERQRRRHDVLPGLTGWAQINGRNETSWSQRLEQDVWYCENVGLRIDLAILARTVLQVASGTGASVPDQMPNFAGGERD